MLRTHTTRPFYTSDWHHARNCYGILGTEHTTSPIRIKLTERPSNQEATLARQCACAVDPVNDQIRIRDRSQGTAHNCTTFREKCHVIREISSGCHSWKVRIPFPQK